jgi:hypothetical protein
MSIAVMAMAHITLNFFTDPKYRFGEMPEGTSRELIEEINEKYPIEYQSLLHTIIIMKWDQMNDAITENIDDLLYLLDDELQNPEDTLQDVEDKVRDRVQEIQGFYCETIEGVRSIHETNESVTISFK